MLQRVTKRKYVGFAASINAIEDFRCVPMGTSMITFRCHAQQIQALRHKSDA